ncbi:MAG: ribose-phosphate pyrophosphokinase [Phycisphaerae bacterium]|jgi:ribose-phosphate pyrophosphokinase|nr:ribose-phosphate pyrophosphokinase [Phycisphaerae bacterium]
MNSLKIFSGNSNLPLATKITEYLGTRLGQGRITLFPDGEIQVKVDEDVRGGDVFVIQSTCSPVNHHLMELLIFIDCLRRASAARITAVLPYFGYARQDRKDEGRVPITAKLVANLLTTAGVDRVLTLDLHAAQIQGFFDIPVDHLLAEPVISYHLKELDLNGSLMLVSPDVGNVKRARAYAQRFNVDLAIIDKRRVSGSDIVIENIIGNVKDKTVLMVDDLISTGGTICNAANLCMDRGAKAVYVAATHPVLCGPAVERLASAPIKSLIVTDTIPLSSRAKEELTGIDVLTVSELLGEAIRRIHRNESVSSLFITG